MIPAIISDLFGLTNYAKTYTFFQLAPAAGGYLLGTLLTGGLYEAAVAAHHEEGYCVGRDCYGHTWMILIALNLVSFCGVRWLFARSKNAYETM